MNVYAITNTANGKIYIGQTCQNLDRYLRSDVTRALLHGKDRKPHLYNAIRKYGAEAFVIRLLVKALDKEQADKLEQFFIRTLETQNKEIGYNIASGGGGSFGYKRTFSDAQREKIRVAGLGRVQSASTREKISIANSGVPKSVEHRAKLSRAKRGIKMGPFSDEHRSNMSKAAIAAHARRKRERGDICPS